MHVEYNIKLEDKELNAIKDLATLHCDGIQCKNCPLFIDIYEHCICHFARKMTDQLEERGFINGDTWRNTIY